MSKHILTSFVLDLVINLISGTVPSLEVLDGVTIGDSLVASEYLDDVYAQRPLLPKDPLKKAQARLITQESSTVSLLFHLMFICLAQIIPKFKVADRKMSTSKMDR